MKKYFKICSVLMVCLSVVVSGCAGGSTGNARIKNDVYVSKIKKGVSSKDDVKALIGEPMSVTFGANGDEFWSYSYSESKVRASSYIPIVGMFTGGGDLKSKQVQIVFNEKGIVKRIGGGSSSGSVNNMNL